MALSMYDVCFGHNMWSPLIYTYKVAEYGSTGYGCKSCTWSVEQENICSTSSTRSAEQGKIYSPLPVRP